LIIKVTVNYIFHNCFVLTLPDRVLLFDYPSSNMLGREAKQKVKSLIEGKKTYLFSSHSHGDHFELDFAQLGQPRFNTKFIFAREIESYLKPQSGQAVYLIDADDTLQLDDMEIHAFSSNDLGVAFLINYAGTTIYFGGDLANWDWEENSPQEAEFIKDIWEQTLQQLQAYRIDLAFSNADARLKNWSGALEFIARVRPQWFVPMHTFGKPQVLKRFSRNLQSVDRVFLYEEVGDEWEIDI
jgi:L-ascorbate metabolism protein UlaG (beta-lactamase superfamily)